MKGNSVRTIFTNRFKAFTLIELLVVVLVLTFLATVIVPVFL